MILSARLLRRRPGRARGCSRNRARPFVLRARLTAAEVCRPQRNLRRADARFFKSSASTIAVSLAIAKDSGRFALAQSAESINSAQEVCHPRRHVIKARVGVAVFAYALLSSRAALTARELANGD